MKHTQINNVVCLKCKTVLNMHSSDSEEGPEKDDISICSSCGNISKYSSDLTLIELSNNELEQFKKEFPNEFLKSLLFTN